MTCFEAHLPGARHRDAGAIEKIAPISSEQAEPRRLIPAATPAQSATSFASGSGKSASIIAKDVLIVASKLKDYIRAKSEMNTSASVIDILSDVVRECCDEAIESAKRDGRKTVLDRDFPKK